MGYWLENIMNKGDVVIHIMNFSDKVPLTYGKSYTVLESKNFTIFSKKLLRVIGSWEKNG